MQANTSPVLCRATRKDGSPCRAVATRSGLCLAHDPSLDKQRSQARREGGRHKAKAVRLQKLIPPRLVPLFDKLELALDQVHSGDLEPRIASAMAALAGAMVRVLTSGELEARVRALEGRKE